MNTAQQGLCRHHRLTCRDTSVNQLERFYARSVVWETSYTGEIRTRVAGRILTQAKTFHVAERNLWVSAK